MGQIRRGLCNNGHFFHQRLMAWRRVDLYNFWGIKRNSFCLRFFDKKIRKTLSKAIPVVLYKCTSIVFTFLFITFSFIFFKAGSFHQAFGIIDKILFQRGKLFVADQRDLRYAYCFIPVLLVTEFVQENKFFNKFSLYNNKYAIIRHLTYYSLVIIILLFGVFDQNQFIYFQF